MSADDRLAGELDDAILHGRVDVVRALAEAGVALTASSPWRRTPLRSAAAEGHPELLRFLIGRGLLDAEPPTGADAMTCALTGAALRPSPRAMAVTAILLEAADWGPRLAEAVSRGAGPGLLRLLLRYGARPGETRDDGTPVLVLAARRGDHAAVDVLLEAGADVDVTDAAGRTALMHAVERGAYPVIGVLLTAGADPELISPDGMTASLLARGWHRQKAQSLLGERHLGLDDVPIVRTTLRKTPAGVRLSGDPSMLDALAGVIDLALADLGDDEWETRTGRDATVAREFAGRLRTGRSKPGNASWYEVEATAEEYATARQSLVELAYGTTRDTPPGWTRQRLTDLLTDLDR